MICKLLSLLRTVVFYSLFLTWTILTSCLIIILSPIVEKTRRHTIFVQPYCHGVLWLCKIICGVKYTVSGQENIPGNSAVIVSNHQSTWETFLLQTLFTPQVQVVKKELISIPFFGWALHLLGGIPIDRGNPKRALIKIIRMGSDFLKDGYWILVFPEGTRKPSGQLGKFSQGASAMAIRSGKPVLPVAHNAGHFWPGNRWVKRPGTVNVIIGPVISIEDKTSKQITNETVQWIREQLNEIENKNLTNTHSVETISS